MAAILLDELDRKLAMLTLKVQRRHAANGGMRASARYHKQIATEAGEAAALVDEIRKGLKP